MKKSRSFRIILIGILFLMPSFLALYMTRGQGTYLMLLSIFFAIPGLLFMASYDHQATNNYPFSKKPVVYLKSRFPLAVFSIIFAICAVTLERRTLSWILANKFIIVGMPRTASLFLIYISSLIFAWEGKYFSHISIFNIKFTIILVLAALVVITFTFISVFGTASMELYTSVMEGTFFLILGACSPVILLKLRHAWT